MLNIYLSFSGKIMDNWIAHILLLMLNIDFLSGFPDLNSFFPFEMEEDFLFALGHRFEPTNHGKMPFISNIKPIRLFKCKSSNMIFNTN